MRRSGCVKCQREKRSRSVLRRLSGSEGRFVFRGRFPGRYYMKADASGYLHDFLVLAGRGGSEFDLAPGTERMVRLALWPEGSVTGRIVG